MNHGKSRQESLVSIDRRTFLRGAAASAAVTAGLEGILAAQRAPAFAQATKIHLLQWVDFIPEGDVEVRRQVAEYTRQTKVEVVFETINANDLQARITAAIQSGAGPDLILMLHNWPHLYASALVDLGPERLEDQGPGRLLPALRRRHEGGQAAARAAVRDRRQ